MIQRGANVNADIFKLQSELAMLSKILAHRYLVLLLKPASKKILICRYYLYEKHRIGSLLIDKGANVDMKSGKELFL